MVAIVGILVTFQDPKPIRLLLLGADCFNFQVQASEKKLDIRRPHSYTWASGQYNFIISNALVKKVGHTNIFSVHAARVYIIYVYG